MRIVRWVGLALLSGCGGASVDADGGADGSSDDMAMEEPVCGDGVGSSSHYCLSIAGSGPIDDPNLVIAFGDADGDGRTDLVVREEGSNSVRLGRGDGTFSGPIVLEPTDPVFFQLAVVGTFDAQSGPQVVLIAERSMCGFEVSEGGAQERWCAHFDRSHWIGSARRPDVYAGAFGTNGERGFVVRFGLRFRVVVDPSGTPQQLLPPDMIGSDLYVADLDGDGRDEVLSAAAGQVQRFTAPWEQAELIDLGGSGSLLAVGDFDGDGLDDLLLATGSSDTAETGDVRIRGSAIGDVVIPLEDNWWSTTRLETADLDLDGQDDLLISQRQSLDVWSGRDLVEGVNALQAIELPAAPPHDTSTSPTPPLVSFGEDVDADGDADLLVLSFHDLSFEYQFQARAYGVLLNEP